MKDLINTLIENNYEKIQWISGSYAYNKGNIFLVLNVDGFEDGGFIAPIIICWDGYSEHRQFKNITSLEELERVLEKSKKLHKGSPSCIPSITRKISTN